MSDQTDPNMSAQALAAQNSLARALMGRVLPNNMLNILGSGMASNAGSALSSAAYRNHVREAQALGQTPMTPQQFQAMQQGQ
jgi:hypothetical protein